MLKQLYVPPPRRQKDGRARRAKVAAKRWVRRRSLHIAASVLVALGWVGVHIHYYNYLKGLEFEVQVASAQIEVQQTRRFRIQKNLSRIVSQYSAYEDKLLTTLTAIRAAGQDPGAGVAGGLRGANAWSHDGLGFSPASPLAPTGANPLPDGVASGEPNTCGGEPLPPAVAAGQLPSAPSAVAAGQLPSAPPAVAGGQLQNPPTAGAPTDEQPNLRELFSKLRVVAEQYPELQLNDSLHQLANAIMESETEIAARIMKYNEAVNNYVTVTDTFPGYIFARLSNFPSYDFYPVDKAQRDYTEVSF